MNKAGLESKANYRLLLSLSFASLSVVSFEIFLARIASAIFLKYFSVLAVSLAMLGLGTGGVAAQILLAQAGAAAKQRWRVISATALCCCLICIPILCAYIRIPNVFLTIGDLFRLFFFISIVFLPFFWGGLYIASFYLAYPQQIPLVYCCDLGGAAAGAALAFLLLNATDGFSAYFASAAVAGLALVLSAYEQGRRKGRISWLVVVLCGGLLLANHYAGWWTLPHPSGEPDANQFERWSEFGLTAVPKVTKYRKLTVSKSQSLPEESNFQLITHDYNCSTWAIRGGLAEEEQSRIRGQLECFPFLFRPGASVLVLGAGGGKEVAQALLSGSWQVTAVEFNRVIVEDIMLGELGPYSGWLYRRPEVEVALDEARNYLSRTDKRFDVILPVTGTTPGLLASGCYVFSTEYLQTKEAYRQYLGHLSPKGVFSFVYSFREQGKSTALKPSYRILATIKEILREAELAPQEHILVVGGLTYSSLGKHGRPTAYSYSTCVMFSPSPFTPEDLKQAVKIAQDMGFELLFPPYNYQETASARPEVERLIRFLLAPDEKFYFRQSKVHIQPVSDDNPYYYSHIKWTEFLNPSRLPPYQRLILATISIFALYIMLLVFLAMRSRGAYWKKISLFRRLRFLAYFVVIGWAYVTLQLTLMQRANFLVGLPALGFLVTVLSFTLGMGVGGLTSSKVPQERYKSIIVCSTVLLILLLGLYQLFWPQIAALAVVFSPYQKMAVIFGLYMPVGFLASFPFILGLRLIVLLRKQPAAPQRQPQEDGGAEAWMWGINAAAASMGVLVTLFWIELGYNITLAAGAFLYLLGALLI